MKKFTVLIVSFLLAFQSTAQQIDLLVVIDDSAPLDIDYLRKEDLKKGTIIGYAFGVLGGVIHLETVLARNKKYSKQFQELVGDYTLREQYITKMVENGFYNETDKIKLNFINIKESNEYFLEKLKLNYQNLKNDKWSYIMIVEEKAGYMTPKHNLGRLSPSTNLKISVYDINKKKRIFKQRFNSLHSEAFEIDSVLINNSLFTSNYNKAVNKLGSQIYFRLNGKDVLHEMGKAHGLEAEFPSTKKILKEYHKNFKYWSQLPDGWIDINSKNDFLFISAPKKDKAVVGIRTDIDLLIKTFGQHNLDIDDYVDIRASRLEDANLTIRPFDENIPPFNLKDKWFYYMVDNPSGGISLMLSRVLHQEYTINHEIILLGDNPIGLLEKHKKDIGSYINKSTITLNKK